MRRQRGDKKLGGKRGSDRVRGLNCWRALLATEPVDREQLQGWVERVLGLRVPERALVEGHQGPLDYLAWVFFEGQAPGEAEVSSGGQSGGSGAMGGEGDVVVWANRGGGKTMLGAVATVLDLVFKPGVQVRILGGSLEQSSKMFGYLRELMDRPLLRPLVMGEATARRLTLVNGSSASVLSQSQRSVRGQRVHKLRCDEVELFEEEVWRAAQMVTQSGWCGKRWVRGTVEALSTMHEPGGMMSRLVNGGAQRVVRWCALDVMERCPTSRDCGTCVLWKDCQGRAKAAQGFVKIEDLIAQRGRVSDAVWASEMMCEEPSREHRVYAGFEVSRHVVSEEHAWVRAQGVWVAGCDFGMRSPLVWLWAKVVEQPAAGGGSQRVVVVMGEYVARGLTLERHMQEIEQQEWEHGAEARQSRHRLRGGVQWVGVDPAGEARNEQTGLSNVAVLRKRGYAVRAIRTGVHEGIEAVRARLDHGTLAIHERCGQLIEAMRTYHFDPQREHKQEPVKDGPDHVCDALRYMVVSLERGGAKVEVRGW